MKPYFKNFFPDNVLSWVSAKGEDFTLKPDQISLNPMQKEIFDAQLETKPFVVTIRQVHGKDVVFVDQHNCTRGFLGEADAVITSCRNVCLTVRTADCLSVFIYDPNHQAIGLVHAGWRSTYLKIVEETLELMQQKYSSRVEDLKIAFGPAIRSCCYEVGKEFLEFFPQQLIERDGRLFLDVASVNRQRLLALGALESNILDCEICTFCHDGHYSFRRDKEKAGRILSAMMLV